MSKDRSLGDFVRESASESATEESRANEPEPQDDTVDTETVEPATPTYRFDPDGTACDGCGETVEKRWHDDGQFVCADCKDW